MAKLKEGDAVIVTAREQATADIKSGLYYPHYAGLYGTVLKIYGDEVSVMVNPESLPTDVRARHEEGEKAMRQKWLDNLSEEARGRVVEKDRNFALNYAVLVAIGDLAPDKQAGKRVAADIVRPSAQEKRDAKEVAQAARAVDPLSGESNISRASRNTDQPTENGTGTVVKRLSASELDAREEAFLAQRKTKGNGAAE